MRHERPDHTLQPTALVNEAYLRMVGKPVSWESRAEFLRAASRVMREVLIDHARARGAVKRGGDRNRVELHDAVGLAESEPEIFLALEDALRKLGERDPRSLEIVELRYFGGLSREETARVLKVSLKTVARDWNFARAWLEQELRS